MFSEYFDKETGTYYLRARYYDPETGRFITEDSEWGRDSDPLSLNLYTYCGNNPVMYIDPTGHTFWDIIGGLAKGADDSLFGGYCTWQTDTVKYNLNMQRNSWDYLYGNCDDYRFGYSLANLLSLGAGVKSLGSGLSLLSTQKGVALVTSTGEIVKVISGTAKGIIESAKGLGISFMAEKNTIKGKTNHGDYRSKQRGFSDEMINDIKENPSQKVYQSGGRTVYAKKNGNFYDVVIVNKEGKVITTVGGKEKTLDNWKKVTKMLNNNGGYSSLPMD